MIYLTETPQPIEYGNIGKSIMLIVVGAIISLIVVSSKDAWKERRRLRDVRMVLFHFLLRWRHGALEQVKEFETALTRYDLHIKEETKPKENINVIKLEMGVPGTRTDILPTQLKRLDLRDVYKILVDKSDKKEQRQRILPELIDYSELSGFLFEEIKKSTSEFILQFDTRLDALTDTFQEIEDTIRGFIVAHNSDSIIFKYVSTLKKISDIIMSFDALKDRSIQTKFSAVINPLFELSGDPVDTLSPEANKLFPLANSFLFQYNKLFYRMQKYHSDLEFWVGSLSKTVDIINRTLAIEYPNDIQYPIED